MNFTRRESRTASAPGRTRPSPKRRLRHDRPRLRTATGHGVGCLSGCATPALRRIRVIVHDVLQRSPEWQALRLGNLTGSSAAAMLATIQKGEAAGRRDLRARLVLQ